MSLYLAPMQGLIDPIMRDLLTRIGGIDVCTTEFLRITNQCHSAKSIQRLAPELWHDAKTIAGTPVVLQLLGSDVGRMAENALLGVTLGAKTIDLNFGCPAPTVNRHGGGAVLLKEPERIFEIVSAVRKALPTTVELTSKMRLGYDNTDLALDCAQAMCDGGVSRITVHARTKQQGYAPPAHWSWIPKIQAVVTVPIVANGEVWTVEDYIAICAETGCRDVMIGRGLVSAPDLAWRIKHYVATGEVCAIRPWTEVLIWLADFFALAMAGQNQEPLRQQNQYAVARLKQWLKMLMRTYAEATILFDSIRSLTEAETISPYLKFKPRTVGL
ncbi:MAG: tRNA-dihydrouridine synthase family protein [Neisseriaceae bacterium]|nr:tRNA-dihydrouridine synthase family protein [Neisseriaceae bacterium]